MTIIAKIDLEIEVSSCDFKSLIMADGGGSNGSSVRLWNAELQKFATEIQKEIQVFHFPPGTSKWNKIEHKMFCYISSNWCAKL